MKKTPQYIVAIDPGKNGSVVHGSHRLTVRCEKMPEELVSLYVLLRQIKESRPNAIAFLEHNTGFMAGIKRAGSGEGGDEGGGGVSPKAMYTFGRVTGHVEMALVAAGIPVCRVTPIKWQNAVAVSTVRKRLMSPSQWKNYLKDHAKKRFPQVPVTLANADALLIFAAALEGSLKHTVNLH